MISSLGKRLRNLKKHTIDKRGRITEEQKKREEQEALEFELRMKKMSENRVKKHEESIKQVNDMEGEVDRYLSTALPTMLLIPAFQKPFKDLVYSTANNKEWVTNGIHEEIVEALKEYYKNEFEIFYALLRSKGFSLKGKEEEFTKLFIDRIHKVNYQQLSKQYGDFLKEENNIKDSLYKYIDVVGNSVTDGGHIDFLASYLYKKAITKYRFTNNNMVKKVEEHLKLYELESKMYQMEQRMNGEIVVPSTTIEDVDRMTGLEFEHFLSDLFDKLSYRVEVTKTTGDQGIDLLASKNNEVIAIQAKCYSNTVGNEAVQQAIAGKNYYEASKCAVITNNYFTKSAKDLASKTRTILWDREKLKEMINLLY
jgi:HJR/Mrr/RecB family endonuclease